ncbi:MAG: hypothetical protein SGILL_010286 [Bacillariaceae sp.]
MSSSSPASSSAEDRIDGLGGLLNLIGIVPARARFVGGAITSSMLSSLTIGLSMGMVGAAFAPTGPLIPFLLGAGFGNTFGLFHFYRSSQNDAMRIARNYPSILAHALWTEWGIAVPGSVVAATEGRLAQHHGKVVDKAAVAINAAATTDDTANLTLDQWIYSKGHKMVGFAILTIPQCHGDVEDIQRHERESLVQLYQEKHEVLE